MNIDYLKYILEVKSKGSISKAAKSLYLNQPYLSKVIQEVEDELGIKIFERSSRGVKLTTEGNNAIAYMQKIVYDFQQLQDTSKHENEVFRLSIAGPRASYISHAFNRFIQDTNIGDNANIIYREMISENVIDLVSEGMINLGIIRIFDISIDYFVNDLLMKSLKCEELHAYSLVILMSKNNKLAQKKSISIHDLKGQMHLLHGGLNQMGYMVSFRRKLLDLEEVNKTLTVYERASQLEILEKNNECFMWVSPMPQELLDKYNLVTIRCHDFNIKVSDNLIYRKDYHLNKYDKQLINYIKKEELL